MVQILQRNQKNIKKNFFTNKKDIFASFAGIIKNDTSKRSRATIVDRKLVESVRAS